MLWLVLRDQRQQRRSGDRALRSEGGCPGSLRSPFAQRRKANLPQELSNEQGPRAQSRVVWVSLLASKRSIESLPSTFSVEAMGSAKR